MAWAEFKAIEARPAANGGPSANAAPRFGRQVRDPAVVHPVALPAHRAAAHGEGCSTCLALCSLLPLRYTDLRIFLWLQSAVDETIEFMDEYFLTREDFESIMALGVGPMDEELVTLETQTKSTFTRK